MKWDGDSQYEQLLKEAASQNQKKIIIIKNYGCRQYIDKSFGRLELKEKKINFSIIYSVWKRIDYVQQRHSGAFVHWFDSVLSSLFKICQRHCPIRFKFTDGVTATVSYKIDPTRA